MINKCNFLYNKKDENDIYSNPVKITLDEFINKFYIFLNYGDNDIVNNLRELLNIMYLASSSKTDINSMILKEYIDNTNITTIFELSPHYDNNNNYRLVLAYDNISYSSSLNIYMYDRAYSINYTSSDSIRENDYNNITHLLDAIQELFDNNLFIHLGYNYTINNYKRKIE